MAKSFVSQSPAAKTSSKAKGVNRSTLVGVGIAGAAVVVLLLAVAAFFSSTGSPPAPDQSTPEATHQAFLRAEAAGQHLAVFDVVTPESQDFLAGMAVLGLHASAAIDKRSLPLLEKYGLKAAHNPMPTQNDPNDPRQYVAAMRKLGEAVPDKRAYYAEALQFFKGYGDESPWDRFGADFIVGPKTVLKKVVVDRDRARGVCVTTFDGKTYERPIVFLRIGGLWRVDLIASWPAR